MGKIRLEFFSGSDLGHEFEEDANNAPHPDDEGSICMQPLTDNQRPDAYLLPKRFARTLG